MPERHIKRKIEGIERERERESEREIDNSSLWSETSKIKLGRFRQKVTEKVISQEKGDLVYYYKKR